MRPVATLLGQRSGGGERGAPGGGVAVTLDRVAAGYDGRLALADLTGTFAPGSLTALVGPNGAGKTTLLNLLAGVARPSAGRINRDGIGPREIGYMPQVGAVDRDFPVTVREFVTLGGWRDLGAFRAPPRPLAAAVDLALGTVALGGEAAARIGALSVGQFRRVLFARLIVQRPRLVLLDEPFAGVDAVTTALLLDQLARWHAEGRTVIAAVHDLATVRAHFPRALVLAARRCLAWDATEVALPTMTTAA